MMTIRRYNRPAFLLPSQGQLERALHARTRHGYMLLTRLLPWILRTTVETLFRLFCQWRYTGMLSEAEINRIRTEDT